MESYSKPLSFVGVIQYKYITDSFFGLVFNHQWTAGYGITLVSRSLDWLWAYTQHLHSQVVIQWALTRL